MKKAIAILFILHLICWGKDQQHIRIVEELTEQTEQIDEPSLKPDLEKCNSSSSCLKVRLEADLKKLEAMYEEKFKRLAPKQEESKIMNRIMNLEYALHVNYPYPTVKEKITEDEKIKVAYKKKFGVPITDLELSITSVYFENNSRSLTKSPPYFSVVRTATGAFAKYSVNSDWLEAKFSMDEWLDFIRNLCKCRINEWEESYSSGLADIMHGVNNRWHLKIYSLDKNLLGSSGGSTTHPPNWDEFIKIIIDMEAKIKERGKKQI
ncbi:MAG: hypothetical protein LBQ87_05700 [Candidatus Fibromonas sp.]|jgi:hypothetical protein|nr:hypothetical protein [Candidatus Fibromonas sp.]